MSNRPHGREDPRGYGPRRDDDRDRDEGRPRGSEPPQSRFGGRGGRPPARSFRPGSGPSGPRSRTPSPRRFDRDSRDFGPLDTRRGYPGPGRDNRRWDRRDEHPRDFSPPWDGPSRRPSPPIHSRTHSPPRGPRVQPTSYTPTPRKPSGPRPGFPGRDTSRPSDQDRLGGPGPSTIANQSTNNVIPPRAPRSMRGSSSPVETRNGTWPNHGSSSLPVRNIDLPTVLPDVEGNEDLEEGEVLSPPRKPLEPPTTIPRQGDRWAPPPRRSLSPRKPSFRSRPVSPDFRDRERDRGWGATRRTLSPAAHRPGSRDRPSESGRNRGTSRDRIPNAQPAPRSTPAPTISPHKLPVEPTKPSSSSADIATTLASPPLRPNTPLLPESQAPTIKREPFAQTTSLPLDRPRTPELPPPRENASISEITEEDTKPNGHARELDTEETSLAERAAEDSRPNRPAAEPTHQTPAVTIQRRKPETTGSSAPDLELATPHVEQSLSSQTTSPDLPPIVEQTDAEDDEILDSPNQDVFREVVQEVRTDVIENGNLVTIAERRAVNLPASIIPPRARAGSRLRHSLPRAESVPSPRTDRSSSPPSELSEEQLEVLLASAIKAAQLEDEALQATVDDQIHLLYSDNIKTRARRRKVRERKDADLVDYVSACSERLNKSVAPVENRFRHLVQQRSQRDEQLRSEYTIFQKRWEKHHADLKVQMAERPSMPGCYETSPSVPDYPGNVVVVVEDTTKNRNRQGTESAYQDTLEKSKLEEDLKPTNLANLNGIGIPGMLDSEERRQLLDDDNDLVDDPSEFYDFAGTQEPIWTEDEKAIFAKIFPNCQKVFGKIAAKLPNKSVRDCVLYYYRTKKDLEWKREPIKTAAATNKKPAKPVPKRPIKGAFTDDLPSPPIQAPTHGTPRGGAAGRGRGGRGRGGGTHTPAESARGRRKVSTVDAVAIEGTLSEATSRAPSEGPVPGLVKTKVRQPTKSKRPRESSVLDPIAGPSTSVHEDVDRPKVEGPDTEMLPPPKRSGKRRKVIGPDGVEIPGTDKGEKRKRTSNYSYWNKEEHATFQRLAKEYPNDPERIAQELPSKTVKQVANRLPNFGDELKPNVSVPRLATGSLDFYSTHEGEQQPRLGEFLDGPSASMPPARVGGLSVNALLNADSSDVRVGNGDHTDAASDGTVDDEGIARPPSRSAPGRPAPPAATYDRQAYMARPYDAYPQRIHSNATSQGAYYPHPSSSTPTPRPYSQQGWGGPPPHQQHPHHPQPHQHQSHPHPHPQQQQQQQPPPHHSYMHAAPRPPPQLGVFGRPPPDYRGRTVYNVLERERLNPPVKDKNRSEGPAFTGFRDDNQGKPDPPPQ